MKLLVCISKAPETTARISFTNNNQEFNKEGVQFIMNPYDEWYSLVRALELKEQHGGTVTVINVGPASNDIIIRKALAIGADDAVRVESIEEVSSFYIATQIASFARDEKYDLIFLGKETIDYNGSQVGGMVAELLDLPFISYATHMDHDGSKATITRDVEGGEEISEISGAMVISVAKGMAEQRIPNMRGIMMAKRKPLKVIPAVNVENMVSISNYELPTEKSGVKMVDPENMDELVRLLHEEAKVI